MSTMPNEEVGKNICNAFKVVHQTYKNLEKFFVDLDSIGEDEGFTSISPRFLRYKSDNDVDGWFVRDFIKLFQQRADQKLRGDSGLRNGPIYLVEADFEGETPQLRMAKLIYDDLKNWIPISVSDRWGFYNPFRDQNNYAFDSIGEYSRVRPNNTRARKESWELKVAIYKQADLVEIDTGEKIRSVIFAGLKELDKVDLNNPLKE